MDGAGLERRRKAKSLVLWRALGGIRAGKENSSRLLLYAY